VTLRKIEVSAELLLVDEMDIDEIKAERSVHVLKNTW
jgi:hypothetical protein